VIIGRASVFGWLGSEEHPGQELFRCPALNRVHQLAQAHGAEWLVMAGNASGEHVRLQVELGTGIPLLELDHPFHAVNYFVHGRLPWV